ncbi:dihydrofolate synthase/folylpolyglutamate synthase [Mycoplasmoides fastidiosum]|uniref:Dihydrofolate synthase/folylpolyglutamate synthase n=1 Tax=Mycoplasmoides fastidiosum TaxID=92758 RepID=A0ABU0LYM5_9BACT|nr:Mur ligase family protein [Mycoplasmoides fastidiosum]MDQ0513720.1 dihydrofolate synthase/folylpolyglutamate synthase [Mycoplasmoides fastidiosum]UUD37857.1 Mur ligase family protein [Mycoplasmoides fastidiosum]
MKNTIELFQDFNLDRGNLERFKKRLKKFSNFHKKLKVIHIVGTNGKGSLSNFLAETLIQNGYKVGLFTSPSFIDHNERIKVNGQMISDTDLIKYLQQIKEWVNNQSINFFEVFTWIAIMHFNAQGCDLCVFEAGIGGEFDSTNVFKNNLATLVTSLSFDHQDVLGSTIDAIAAQKLLIAKKQEPVFISYSNKNIKPILLKIRQDLIFVNYRQISNDLFINDAACSLIKFCKYFNYKLDYEIFRKNILGRLSLFSNNVLLDGAHNFHGIKKMYANLRKNFAHQKIIIVYSSLQTKNYQKSIKYLSKKLANRFYVSFFQHDKAIAKDDVDTAVSQLEWDQIKTFVAQMQQEYLIVFCGSIYFISAVYDLLSLDKFQEMRPILPVRIKS